MRIAHLILTNDDVYARFLILVLIVGGFVAATFSRDNKS